MVKTKGVYNQGKRDYSQENQRKYHHIDPSLYFTEDGGVKEDLFSEDAKLIAESFKGEMRNSQLRKFYDEILKRKLIIELKKEHEREDEFKRQLPYIKMMIAKVYYALKRRTVGQNFKRFIEDNIGKVKTLKEFLVFCDLFEAVVAYSKYYLND